MSRSTLRTAETALPLSNSPIDMFPGDTGRTERKCFHVEVRDATTSSRHYELLAYRRDVPYAATQQQIIPYELDETVKSMFERAKEELFEDGISSIFSKELASNVKLYGSLAIVAIAPFLINGRVNAEVGSETLRWLGLIDDESTYRFRRWLIERCLHSRSTRMRDSAALSLAIIDDSHSVSALSQALEIETCPEVRDSMRSILQYLQRSR